MAGKVNKNEKRTTLYLRELKTKMVDNVSSDPRFSDLSAYGRHVIQLGIERDEEQRAQAIANIRS